MENNVRNQDKLRIQKYLLKISPFFASEYHQSLPDWDGPDRIIIQLYCKEKSGRITKFSLVASAHSVY